MKQQSVSFEDHQHEVIKDLANSNKRSFSNMVILLIEEALKQRDNQATSSNEARH
jgi:hypothetical protein